MTVLFRAALAAAVLATAAPAMAAPGQCHVVDVKFTTAPTPNSADRPQMVAWIESAAGEYKSTIYITSQTGSFGLGNRPGRYDFNSGPMWPYGRRITTFPVWAHKKTPLTFPSVVFQNMTNSDDPDFCFTQTGQSYTTCGENNLSHPFADSSHEYHFCQPLAQGTANWNTAADSMTCATQAFTDKGMFSTSSKTSNYPPRTDLSRMTGDSPSVLMYKAMNPFDAVSQATPPFGQPQEITWPISSDLPPGDYVLWVEVSQAFDTNNTYNSTSYPPPSGIAWSSYGVPYRGQPSVLYKVPFTIGATETFASTADYAGYGDPDGKDGNVRAPDATITTDTPGTGASRLQLVSDSGRMYRVLVDSRPEMDAAPPDAPAGLEPMQTEANDATFRFVAPGDDGQIGKVSGYDVRVQVGTPIDDSNFDQAMVAMTSITPVNPGQLQSFQVLGLLPQTDYYIAVRAFDDCHNTSPVMTTTFTTASRQAGEVDACFVATAAYGSIMANDVEMLRHFRDALLESNVIGELAVETYYTFGPAVAGVVGESDLLRATARDLLRPLVAAVRRLAA